VLRIEREGEEVTVFYRPNSLCLEELSRSPVANALAVTFLLPGETVRASNPPPVQRANEFPEFAGPLILHFSRFSSTVFLQSEKAFCLKLLVSGAVPWTLALAQSGE
jgi:hypothetical protein